MRTPISEFSKHVGTEVLFQGWVYNLRSSGKISFLQLRDGSGRAQAIVAQAAVSPEVWQRTQELTIESSVEITGVVSKHPKLEQYELQVKDVHVLQIAPEYPIGKKEHGPDFLLNQRHLWLRSERQWAVQRVRAVIIKAMYDHLYSEGFVKFDAPILTPNACEGTTELFEMEYFDSKAYLTQSGQLYLEAGAMALGKVFDFGPVFRAEKSKTRRHLTEFWMLDAEEIFVDYIGNMDSQERLVKAVLKQVLEECAAELRLLERDTAPLHTALEKPFMRMTHSEAVAQLKQLGSDIGERDDMGADDETILTQQYDVPVFVTHYPAEVKAFYMKRNEEGDRVLGSDLLAPEGYGEIIGGSEREINYDVLLQRIHEHNLPLEAFQWYLDLRKYGTVPHSGYGIGLERTVAWICGLKHVRETIPFPRMINRVTP